jgi:hypothetical protein
MLKEKVESPQLLELCDVQRALRSKTIVERDHYRKTIDKETVIVQKASVFYVAKCKEYSQGVDKKKKSVSSLHILSTEENRSSKDSKAKTEMDKAELDFKAAISRINSICDTLDDKFISLADDVQRVELERGKLIRSTMEWMLTSQVELFSHTASV